MTTPLRLLRTYIASASLAAALVVAAGGARSGQDTRDLSELRARWESLSEEERADLRERLAELKKLPADEQHRLREQATGMHELARKVYRGLDPALRTRVDRLAPRERHELMREMAVAEAQDFGRRILNKIPAEDRARLEGATDEERVTYFLEFRERMSVRIGQTMMRMGPELGISPEQIAQLENMPAEKRRGKFLEIVKRRTLRAAQTYGLPAGLPQERWNLVADLPPDEFYVTLLRLRRKFPELGQRPNVRTARGEGAAQMRLRRSLMLYLDPEEMIGMSNLGGETRVKEVRRRQRERALRVIREEGMLSADEIQELAGSPDTRFFFTVRELSGAGRPRPRRPGTRSPGEDRGRDGRGDERRGRD